MASEQTDKKRFLAAMAEVESCLMLYETEPQHTRHVAMLALTLMRALEARHSFGVREIFILEAAALLHDIGWSETPDGRGHHKHSYRMIMEFPWTQLEPLEVHLMALVARYHRKSLPAQDHPGYGALPREKQLLVQQLASFVRVADALDRSHTQRIQRLLIQDSGSSVKLLAEATVSPRAELFAVDKKKDLFELVWSTQLQIEPILLFSGRALKG